MNSQHMKNASCERNPVNNEWDTRDKQQKYMQYT